MFRIAFESIGIFSFKSQATHFSTTLFKSSDLPRLEAQKISKEQEIPLLKTYNPDAERNPGGVDIFLFYPEHYDAFNVSPATVGVPSNKLNWLEKEGAINYLIFVWRARLLLSSPTNLISMFNNNNKLVLNGTLRQNDLIAKDLKRSERLAWIGIGIGIISIIISLTRLRLRPTRCKLTMMYQ